MADDILIGGLEQTMDRRSFLRRSALVAAALGAGLVAPPGALAQEQQQEQKKKNEKKDDKQHPKKGEKKKSGQDENSEDEGAAAEDGKPQTLVDAEGREYRSCPQCGSSMYRQGRTWTCEYCGYSYVE